MTGMRIHGGMNFQGDSTEIKNFELEHIVADPVNPDQGTTWLNTTLNRLSYADATLPIPVIRRIVYMDDISSLNTYLVTETNTRIAADAALTTAVNTAQITANAALSANSTITAIEIETALGYTPYSAANPAGYISSVTYANINGIIPIWNQNTNGYANASIPAANVTGTADAISLMPIVPITGYIEGQEFIFPAKFANLTNTCTIDIQGFGPLFTYMGSVPMPIDGLIINNLYRVRVEGAGPYTARVTPYDAVSANGDTVNGSLKVTGNLFLSSVMGAGILNGLTYGWRDLVGFLNPLKSGTTGYPTVRLFYGTIEEYSHSINDKGKVNFHIPHDYAPNTDIFIHIHWGHNGTACSGIFTVTLTCTYAKGHQQITSIFNVPIVATVSVPVTITDTPQYLHRVDEVQLSAAMPSANLLDTALLEPDGILLVQYKVTSIPTISGGTTVEPFIFSIDIHHQSTNITTKNKSPNFYA